MSVYYSFKASMLKCYGFVLHSIPVDLDLGCPNREIDGSGGCTFCPEHGARAIQNMQASSVEEQIKKAINFAKKRYGAKEFMLYIQAYTGTFTSVINQKEAYSKLLKLYDFKAISIGTRPDCLSKETLEYLQELNKQIDVYVDLGIQTLNDKTLQKINRGHDSKTSLEAIKKLQKYGIKTFAHLIIGFEDESRDDWENSVKKVVDAKVDGIKLHNLHIIKNTALAKEYEAKKFKILNEYEYAQELIYLLRLIPSSIPILRLCTDTPSSDLLAPKWHMSKGEFIRFVQEEMVFQDARQGDLIEKKEFIQEKEDISKAQDASCTLWSKKYRSYYHPKSGALTQARELFLKHSKLEKLLTCKNVNLLDIGFGMGYNSLEALRIDKRYNLHIDALDRDLQVIRKSAKLLNSHILDEIYTTKKYSDEKNSLNLHISDARHSIKALKDKFYDVIFLDPFLYTQNTTLITKEFLTFTCKKLKDDGVIVCSTNIQAVRVAFSELGFMSEIVQVPKSDIQGIVIKKGFQKLEGVPYSDPYLVYRDKQIITARDEKLARK